MSTRRDFIKTAAITTVALLPPTKALSLPINHSKPKVIILGAGLSGLAAGYALIKQGIDPIILEARSRIGGRVFSHIVDQPENLVVELGAEWIGASHERIISLSQELGLTLENNQLDTNLLYKGHYLRRNQWDFSDSCKATLEKLLQAYSQLSEIEKIKLDSIDWWKYLVNNGIDGRDLDIIELLESTDFGESIRFVSTFTALEEYEQIGTGHEMDYKIKGGNYQLAKALADKIGFDKILTDCKVTDVFQSGGKIKVICEDGYTIEGDRVICTLPTFAIAQIHWHPSLPPEKLEAINALQYNRITKNVFLYSHRFWKDEDFEVVSDGPIHHLYHGTKNQPSAKGALISYSIGDKAEMMSKQSDEWKSFLVEATLNPVFGSTKQYLVNQIHYYWGDDAYTRGSYALYGRDQWFNLRPILQQPFGHVHFAGEHLADWQGFMEGAINTGEAAAQMVLET